MPPLAVFSRSSITVLVLSSAGGCGIPEGEGVQDLSTAGEPSSSWSSAAQITSRDLTTEQAIDSLWRDSIDNVFQAASAGQKAAATAIVPDLLQGLDPDDHRALDLAGRAAHFGLRLEVWRVDAGRYWVLTEPEDAVHGAGSYLFRADRPVESAPGGHNLILQAPHAFFDYNTGRIAAHVFFGTGDSSRAVALFTNSIHRYQDRPGLRDAHENGPADVAHNPDHLFSTATTAAAGVGPFTFVQIHGYADREDHADTDAIVSAGRKTGSTARSLAVAEDLSAVFGESVKRYPEQIQILGATTNSQGHVLSGYPTADFVHVELSATLRRRIMDGAANRNAFANSLVNGATDTLTGP